MAGTARAPSTSGMPVSAPDIMTYRFGPDTIFQNAAFATCLRKMADEAASLSGKPASPHRYGEGEPSATALPCREISA